jgi:hypothetical protein
MKKILSIIAFLVISIGLFATVSHDRILNGGTIDLTNPSTNTTPIWNLTFGGSTADTISSLVAVDTVEYTFNVSHYTQCAGLLELKVDTFGTVRDTTITINVFQSNLTTNIWFPIKNTSHSAITTTYTPLKDGYFEFSFREWATTLEGTRFKIQIIAPHAATSRGVKAKLSGQFKLENY